MRTRIFSAMLLALAMVGILFTGPTQSQKVQTIHTEPVAAGSVSLWPFVSLAQEQVWERANNARSSFEPWHTSAALTASKFTTVHLGFREMIYVTNVRVTGATATVGVAWKYPGGTQVSTAAVLSLIKLGRGWTVVGSKDTYLTLTLPVYGARISSPVVVGGRIWGVDESLNVKIVSSTAVRGRSPLPGTAAGGQGSQYFIRVSYSNPVSGTALAIVVSTGGHVTGVERFAITAVRQR